MEIPRFFALIDMRFAAGGEPARSGFARRTLPAPFSSWSAKMVRHSIPARSGNFAMIEVDPADHMGRKPRAIASSAVSRPSAKCKPLRTSSSGDQAAIRN